MPNRILREGIISSDRVDRLSFEAEVFYRRLMSIVDDYGRFSGDARLIRSLTFPLRADTISVADIDRWLAECSAPDVDVVRCYHVLGKRYIEVTRFRQQIRSNKSKYPADPNANSVEAQTTPPLEPAKQPHSKRAATESGSSPYPYPYPYSESESKTETETDASAESKTEESSVEPVRTEEKQARAAVPALRSENGTPGNGTVIQWGQVKIKLQEFGIKGGPLDWGRAEQSWRQQDYIQQQRIYKSLIERILAGDQVGKDSLPQTYIDNNHARSIRAPASSERKRSATEVRDSVWQRAVNGSEEGQ